MTGGLGGLLVGNAEGELDEAVEGAGHELGAEAGVVRGDAAVDLAHHVEVHVADDNALAHDGGAAEGGDELAEAVVVEEALGMGGHEREHATTTTMMVLMLMLILVLLAAIIFDIIIIIDNADDNRAILAVRRVVSKRGMAEFLLLVILGRPLDGTHHRSNAI